MSRACDDAMREDELVEALRERLFKVWMAAGREPGDKNEAMARECLRQMRWARCEAMDESVKNVAEGAERIGSDYRMEILEYGHCTVAPEGWQP